MSTEFQSGNFKRRDNMTEIGTSEASYLDKVFKVLCVNTEMALNYFRLGCKG
jgi:hypothetical protein